MIPLSLWLSDHRLQSLASDVPSVLKMDQDWLADGDGPLNIEVRLAAAREQALDEGRRETESMVSAAREEEKAKSMAREAISRRSGQRVVLRWLRRVSPISDWSFMPPLAMPSTASSRHFFLISPVSGRCRNSSSF